MRVVDRMDMQLRSAREALERIHVLGAESGLMSGALEAISDVIAKLEIIKKEGDRACGNQGKGENVQNPVDLPNGASGANEADARGGERGNDGADCAGV